MTPAGNHAFVQTDNRFRAAARLLQALWREDRDLPIGVHPSSDGRIGHGIGSSITIAAGMAGANFIHPAIAQLARRELVYREPGAVYDDHRFLTNLLSSQPLVFNLFGPLRLNLAMATTVFQEIVPDFMTEITAILFEHSPGRGDRRFNNDHTAFDVLIRGLGPQWQRRFIAIEVKYSEDGNEPPPRFTGRYDEIASTCDLFRDPMDPALWTNPNQQLFRQICLAHTMIQQGLYDEGLHLFIAPEHNAPALKAASSFMTHLKQPDGGQLPFMAMTLENITDVIACVGSPAHAKALHRRYSDWWLIDGELNMENASGCDEAGFDYSAPAYRPPITLDATNDGEGDNGDRVSQVA